MLQRLSLTLALLALSVGSSVQSQEAFVGSFAEPKDGGNLDTALSTFDGSMATIVPRAHASEAVGGASRWRNVLFAIRGVQGKSPAFVLPLISPGSGKTILSGDLVSFQNIKLVWSYEPNSIKWTAFDQHLRLGSSAATWKVQAQNNRPFEQDVVYVSINEHFPVSDYYEWLEAEVFTHPSVKPTASEATAGTFVIGYQSGAPASSAFSRAIPDMPLFGFVIRDAASTPKKLVVLVSGQHPYEGQNKIALQAAVDWILNSTSAEAKAYRQTYTTVVYPFVNPTGELAGLWRGTAYQPTKDTNRNWNTTETIPSRNRGIDTVIVHKNAMIRDIAAIGLGEPYAVFDYHQNFGDRVDKLDYVLHSSASADSTASLSRQMATSDFSPYFNRLNALSPINEIPSDMTTQETLRGYMVARGATLPLTFERSVYHTLASEWAFGIATVQALVPPIVITPDPVVTNPPPIVVDPTPQPPPDLSGGGTEPPPPVTEPNTPPPENETPEEPTPQNPSPETPNQPPPPPVQLTLVSDDFMGSGTLASRVPEIVTAADTKWWLETGAISLTAFGTAKATNTARATIDAGQADVEVETMIDLQTGSTGIILRSVDRSNFLRLAVFSTGWELHKTIAGVTSLVGKGKMPIALKARHTLKATLSGPLIAISLDGATVGSVSETFSQSATRFGIVCSGSGSRSWESFVIRKL